MKMLQFYPVLKYDKNVPLHDNCFITLDDIKKALQNLNLNKSPGPKNLHPKLLKKSSTSLAKPFKIPFEITLKEGEIPTEWKSEEIRPIFKKGDKPQPGNYRPVGLTSVVCKCMRSFIKNELNKHLIDNDTLSQEQFCFVSGRNTVTQMLTTINEWM